MAARKPILAIAGVGGGGGTGFATARVFSQAGYKVALIARNAESLSKAADQLKQGGGEAAPFPVESYNHSSIKDAFSAIKTYWPDEEIRVSVFNVGHGVWKGFLDVTEEDIKETVNTNIVAAFAFARESILSFKDQPLNEQGKRGTLIFTGATAGLRGNTTTSAMAAGKFGLRALSQSLNKEFGKQNIHVAHSVIDGLIKTDRIAQIKDAKTLANEDAFIQPESIAKSYLYLANQDRSAWTWELDLRPAHENW